MSAEIGDGGWPEPVVMSQRPHHPGLIHGGKRAWRTIGVEQRRLFFCGRQWLFAHDRDFFDSPRHPQSQPLESIDDLVAVSLSGNDSQRHHGKLLRVSRAALKTAAAKMCQAGFELPWGNEKRLGLAGIGIACRIRPGRPG
jgi:hypothetical protein